MCFPIGVKMKESKESKKFNPQVEDYMIMDKDNCYACKKPIQGKWDSTIQLGIEMKELKGEGKSRFFFRDKCIRCSPSRSQHIVHPRFPPVKDDREQYNKEFWDKDERSKYQKLYTKAWVHLQEKYNPNWIAEEQGELVAKFNDIR